jgi:hypothetical protein
MNYDPEPKLANTSSGYGQKFRLRLRNTGLKRCRLNKMNVKRSENDVNLLIQAEDHLNFSFPHLREITDYVLLYRANQIRDLSTILPK